MELPVGTLGSWHAAARAGGQSATRPGFGRDDLDLASRGHPVTRAAARRQELVRIFQRLRPPGRPGRRTVGPGEQFP
jgi:hypothetical protein